MTDVTRRQFLRNASIGAAAVGVLAAGGTGLVTAIESTGSSAAGKTLTGGAATPAPADAIEGSDVFARVVDAKAGHIKIFVGTKSVDYTNPALAQQLMQAVQ